MIQKSILIVDDEKRMADSLRVLLRSIDYAADVAYDGGEAIERLARHEYPVVVTDLRMKGVDGLELIQHIHTHYAKTLVIVTTAYASTESAIEAMHYQVFDYLRKPFDFELLRLAVDKAFQRVETDQLRADTAAMIGHDIKIPLTSIIGFAAMINDRDAGGIHPRAAEFAETIEANGQKILELIDNYLTTCKIEEGTLSPCPLPVNLKSLIEDVVSSAMFSAHRCNCEIVRHLDGLPEMVRLDECLIYRAVGNLIHNAIKYNDNGLPVAIHGWTAPAGESPLKQDSIAFSVENHSSNAESIDLEGIFTRFRRGTFVHGVEGTGIGLYVVEAVIRAHGGYIAVERADPDIIRFTIFLPSNLPSASLTGPKAHL